MSRNPKELATLMGFQHHPLWTALMDRGKPVKSDMHRVLSCIVYSLDAWAQFTSQAAAASKRKKRRIAEKKQITNIFGAAPPRPAFCYDLVRRSAIKDHMQQVMRPGAFYSMPKSVAQCCGLSPLADATTAGLRELSGTAMVLEADGGSAVEGHAAHADGIAFAQESSDIYLRVVSPRPSALKTVPLAAADARRLGLQRRSMCVTFHPTRKVGDDVVEVGIDPLRAPGAANPLALLSANVQDIPSFVNQLLEWRVSGDAAFFAIDGADCPRSILQKFVGMVEALAAPLVHSTRKQPGAALSHLNVTSRARWSAELDGQHGPRASVAGCWMHALSPTAIVFFLSRTTMSLLVKAWRPCKEPASLVRGDLLQIAPHGS
jgi:hypothetical protein